MTQTGWYSRIITVHDFLASAKRAARQSSAYVLPEGRNIGLDAEFTLNTPRPAARGLDLVEYQKGADPLSLLSESPEEFRRSGNIARGAKDWLNNHCGEVVDVLGYDRQTSLDVVVICIHEVEWDVDSASSPREHQNATMVSLSVDQDLSAACDIDRRDQSQNIGFGARVAES